MKPGASKLKWCISLAVVACVIFAAVGAFAQNAQGLAAVGAIDPANGYPRWYLDKNGLQLGQCLDAANPADPCAIVGTFPNPGQPISFPNNFPDEFFYWRTTSTINNIGNVGGRALLVMSTQAGFGGATGTAADGAGTQIVFARYRVRVLPNGLVPGATYVVTGPFGAQSFVATATGTINFTVDQGCLVGGALPCNFASVLPTTNAGPFLTWDPATPPAPTAGFIGDGLLTHTITGSPSNTNFFRIQGPDVGGSGVNVVETNLFTNVIGKIYVRPATSTTLNSTPNPSVFGQAVTLTATVAPVLTDPLVPTGSVTFKDGATTLGTVALVNGSASLVTSTLAAGSHSLTASYGGSLEFAVSTSAVRTQTVNPGQTTTTLTSTPNPSLAGQTVTLSTTVTAVAPAVGVPTGTVTFRDGAAALGTVTLVNGNASLNVSTLTVGSHSLTAVYNASPNFLGSTSPTVTQVVNSPTTTSLSSTPNPSVIGQTVTLTATVSPVPPAVGTPTGTVTFNDGTTSLGTATLVNGTASLTISTLAVGSHPLTAAYSGGGNFQASTSATVTQTVNQGNTSTTLISTPNPSNVGQAVTLTATVSAVSPAAGVPTGTVTFRDGNTALAVVTLVNGSASLTISTLATGNHSLTAVYGGSPSFLGSTSPVVNQAVNLLNTSTSLTSTPNPSTTGQAVTLTATVSPVPPASGVPTGTVTFRDGATSLGTVTLVNGSASLTISTLALGSHSLTAVYSGSATFATSTSPVVNQVVNAPAAAATSTTINSTPNPSSLGQTVTLSATVTSGAGVPTGTVTFRDGATALGTVTLVNGSASLNVTTLAVGSHSLTAAFNGNATFAASTSAVRTQTVNAGNSSTSLTSSPNPSTVGQTVTLSSTVSAVAPATGVPTGTVTFRDGATSLGVVTLVNGSASLSISTLAAGSHSLTAVYSGDASFAASTSATVTQIVNAAAAAATSTSLTSTPNPSTVGQTVTLSSTVTSGAGVPTGTVTFRDGAATLGTVTLVNGSASLSISTLAAGNHSLVAVYNGTASFAPSTSPTVTQLVNNANTAGTTTSLTSSASTIKSASFITFTATVSPVPAVGTPTGSVSFFDGTTLLATAPLNAAGQASLVTRRLQTVGSHSITAVYNGDANFTGSTSPAFIVTVTP